VVALAQANPAQQSVPQVTESDTSSGRPFIHYSRRHSEPGPINAGGVSFGQMYTPQDIPAIGYLRDMWVQFQATGGSGSAAPVATPDAPWSTVMLVEVLDIGGQATVSFDGYGWFLSNLLGGYTWNNQPTGRPSYAAFNTASGAEAGGYAFSLLLPFELNKLSGYASLPNENAAANYKLRLNLNGSAAVYTTPPVGFPTFAINTQIDVWTKPVDANAPKAPVGNGSTAYWTQQTYNTVTGFNDIQLTGRKGNPIIAQFFVFRDSSGARYSVNGVTDFRYRVNSFDQIGPTPMSKFLDEAYDGFGVILPVGVWPISFRQDFNDHPAGDDTMERYLDTSGATKLELAGTLPSGAAGGSLTVYTHDFIPQGPIPYALA
jgi:hypothetical protein